MSEERIGDDAALGGGRSEPPERTAGRRKNDRQQANDRSGWNWLLVPAIVIPLLVPLYNRVEPTLFGWPFFYWGQLAFIALGVATTSIVYQKTKTRTDRDTDLSRSATGPYEGKGR